MNYVYSKRDIKNMLLSEGNDYKVYTKKQLRLTEDAEDTAYASNMDDMSDAVQDSTTNDVVIDKSTTDGNPQTNKPVVDVNANNVADAKQQIRANNNNPTYKKLGDNMSYKVHINSSVDGKPTLDEMRKNAISLTKKELNEMFLCK